MPLVQQASGGALQINNIDLTGQAASTGVAVAFATDVAANSLGRDVKIPAGWTVSIPASPYNGSYATLIGALIGGPTVGVEVNLALSSAANLQREISFMTAASLRWRVVTDSSTESGSNAGANFSVVRFNDAGTTIDSPFVINRATGKVTMGSGVVGGPSSFSGAFSLVSMPASTSYASDAAAAAGGVAVGQCYRNGSVVQVRVA